MAPVGCLVEAAKAKKEGKKLVHQCDKNGDYLAKQCFPNGGWCWCADTDGVPVPKTFFNNKMPVAKQPNCEAHRNTTARTRMDLWTIPLTALDTSSVRHGKLTIAFAPRDKSSIPNYVFVTGTLKLFAQRTKHPGKSCSMTV